MKHTDTNEQDINRAYPEIRTLIDIMKGGTLSPTKENVFGIGYAIVKMSEVASVMPGSHGTYLKAVLLYAADRVAQDIMVVEGPAQ